MGAEISARFDEALATGSISATALRVLRNGVPVSGLIEVEGDRLKFVPRGSLDYGSSFEVVLEGGVSDAAGNPLGAERRWGFHSEVFSSELPIVRIDPLGEAIPDDPKIPARMSVALPDAAVDYEGWIGIELRGSSSLAAPKKQFGFETWDESQDEIEVELLGMPEESDWILQGNYFDSSLLRNYFALELSRATGRYAPRMRFAELFLAMPEGDYHYWGAYAVMEKIKRDSNRVPLKRLEPTHNAEPEITGGYLLQIDRADAVDSYFVTSRGTLLLHEYPKGEDITPEQAAWIEGFVEAFETALVGPDFTDPVEGYRAYLDVDSMVDFFLVNEALKNIDAFSFSTFLYKERGEKLKMGPVWDFDLAMGNLFGPSLSTGPEGWLLCEGRWIGRILEDPDFLVAAATRYQALRPGPWSDEAVAGIFDRGLEEWGEAAERNMLGWYGGAEFSYEGRVTELRAWLQARLAWMDSHIEKLCEM